ncbi:MAG: hypothetical protein ACI898_001232 [Flavobacteriales bacterium]
MDLNRILGLITVLLIGFVSCKRDEPTSWDIAGRAPVARGVIDWSDLIADSLLEVDEAGILHLIYEQSLVDLGIDTLVEIADTTVSKQFEPGFAGGPIEIAQGTSIISLDENINLNVNSAELREIIVESGVLTYKLRSYVGGQLDVNYSLPGVIVNGEGLEIDVTTESADGLAPWEYSNTVDLSGASIDLQGTNGNQFNKVASLLSVSAAASSLTPIPVFGDDSVTVELSFKNVRIAYARGFFGEINGEINEAINLEPLANIAGGSLDLETLSFELEIKNYIGADAQVTFNEISGARNGEEVILNHVIINNQINITRAIDNDGGITPNNYAFVIDETNSNIVELFELLPSVLNVVGDITLNPLGDVSGGNDFIYTAQPMEAVFKADLPLCLGMNGVFFRDTLALEATNGPLVGEGKLNVRALNSFPMNAQITLRFLDEREQEISVLLEEGNVSAGIASGDEYLANESNFSVLISSEVLGSLNAASKIVLEVTMNTEGEDLVKMYGGEKIDLLITAEGSIQLSYE